MRARHLRIGIGIAAAWAVAACGNDTGASPSLVEKTEAAQAHGDAARTGALCERLGLEADCDLCAGAGWYGDGECDAHCAERDRDCARETCGGVAGLACPAGQTCVDDPSDDCDPDHGGADCIGICETGRRECGGFLGLECPADHTCVDDPSDDCDPDHGGADCIGICEPETAEPARCGGFAGLACPHGERCVDDPSDDCDPDHGGADCIGICEPAPAARCGGFAGLECPDGERCVDDPSDDCDPDHGGADCIGVCVR